MRAPAPTSEETVMDLDIVLGVAVAVFLLVYMTYALLWPEKL